MNVRYQYKYNNLTTIENGGIHNLKYLSSKPNALTDHKFENNNQVINYTATNSVSDSHEYTYTTFDKLASINQADGNVMLEMEYGVDQQRIHMQVADHGNMIIDNYYIGTANMEVNKGEGFSYLYAEGKPFAIHKQSTDEIFYLHLDNQGSLMAISNNDGDIVETRSYDAWGRPRNPYAIWIYDQTSTFGGAGFGITTRGYTMHEHLEMFNLINMNGRLYDPVLGRMLSPDNYIQSPDNTQSYNRYSYCVNNPLKYTDPSGNEPVTLILAAVAIYSAYQAGSAVNGGKSIGYWDWNAKTVGAVVIGGATGYLAGAAGGAIAAGGGVFSGTAAILAGSYINSVGMKIATQRQSHFTLSIGAASYDFDNGELGYLGKEGNSGMENIGYGLGALTNLSDVANAVDGFTHWEDKLAAKSKAYMDKWTKDNPNAQVDPASLHGNGGTRSYPSYAGNNPRWWNPTLKNGKGAWADYMGMVEDWGWKEYPGYLHDAEYIEMGINKGAKFLLGSWKTYGADIRLMSRTLYLGLKHGSAFEILGGSSQAIINTQKLPYGWMIKKPH